MKIIEFADNKNDNTKHYIKYEDNSIDYNATEDQIINLWYEWSISEEAIKEDNEKWFIYKYK